jgi:hypothetical protein
MSPGGRGAGGRPAAPPSSRVLGGNRGARPGAPGAEPFEQTGNRPGVARPGGVPPTLGGRNRPRPQSPEADDAARRGAVRPGLDRPATPEAGGRSGGPSPLGARSGGPGGPAGGPAPLGGSRPPAPGTGPVPPPGGRSAAGTSQPAARPDRDRDRDETVEDETLWTVEAPAAPVIETPAEQGPGRAGPALGRG